jgi:hypothetical protein
VWGFWEGNLPVLPGRTDVGLMERMSMILDEIKEKVLKNEYDYTLHAEIERKADRLTFSQIEAAILEAEILERYPDGGRGESCLLLGFSENTPIHVVCGWRGTRIVLITVYVPKPPKFVDPWTRSAGDGK